MKRKRLIIFMPSIEGGGVEKNLFIISRYLVKKIKDISLITVSNSYRKKFDKKIKFISPKNSFWDSVGRRKKFFIGLLMLFFEILKNRNALVLCFQGNIYCTFLCKILGIKIIVRSNSAPDGWSQNFFKHLCFKYIFRLSDIIIVNSKEFKKKFKKKFDLNTICIYNPLDKNRIIQKSRFKSSLKFDKKKFNIINVARFTDQKDQITLLKAVNLIKNKISLQLTIVGRGKEEENLKKFINNNNLNGLVRLVNFTNNPYNLINSSDIFILSSLYEGLPNVLLESQVLKKFIISTNCPTGPKEILMNGKAGFLFKPKDYKNLAKLIIYAYKNKSKLKKMSNLGYKNLFRFDYNTNIKKYYSTINSIL